MKVIIDRFEGELAVVELNGKTLNAPRALFAEAREGDIVELTVLPRDSDETAAQFVKLRRKSKRNTQNSR